MIELYVSVASSSESYVGVYTPHHMPKHQQQKTHKQQQKTKAKKQKQRDTYVFKQQQKTTKAKKQKRRDAHVFKQQKKRKKRKKQKTNAKKTKTKRYPCFGCLLPL